MWYGGVGWGRGERSDLHPLDVLSGLVTYNGEV